MTVRRLLLLTLVALALGAALGACQLVGGRATPYEYAFVTDWSGNKEILVKWPDDGDNHYVTCNDYDDDDPALSPDGRRLAFASDRGGDWDIYLLDGRCIQPGNRDSSVTRLTDASGADRHPAWSPDGKYLAFESQRTGLAQIFLMDRDGTNQRQLTFGEVDSHAPAWSPDGSRIAFHARSEPGGTFDIFSVDLAGTDRRRITSSPGNDESPAWAPKSQIAFVSDHDGDAHIYIIDLTTLKAVRVSNGPGSEIDPTWCRATYNRDRDPGGNDLCFASNRDGQWDIYVQPVSGGNAVRELTQGPSSETSPAYPVRISR
jgi:TolB protein